MAGRRSWREIQEEAGSPEARVDAVGGLLAGPPSEEASQEHRAAFWLARALDVDDYADARRAVREELGLDPDAVPHDPPAEVTERLADVRNAVGSARLAGLEPDAATVADMERVARGELTFEAAHAALFARIGAERRMHTER